MAKYDVYEHPDKSGYLLDVQADLLDQLNTRVVVPLLAKSRAPKPATRLNPEFKLKGKQYVMVTQFIATVPRSILKDPVSNLREEFAEITSAIDMLIQGF
ncbi:MAG: CcdB family protein [Paracoccaceae bacterium]